MADETENEPADRNIRCAADIADMLGWIAYFEKKKSKRERKSVTQIVDPMLRDEVVELYAPHAKEVSRIAKALGLELRQGQKVPKPPSRT